MPMSNSEGRKRAAERHADDSAAMDIDPNPPGVTQRPFTEAEVAALDGESK
jgi:hypothetical protein